MGNLVQICFVVIVFDRRKNFINSFCQISRGTRWQQIKTQIKSEGMKYIKYNLYVLKTMQ